MNFCPNCGRETHDHCVCLSRNPIPRWQVWFLYVTMIGVPVMTLSFVKGARPVWDIDYLMIGGLVLASIILVITTLDVVFKRPYLALLFGCHQRLERSFTMLGQVLPLCARCTGIYVGTMVVVVVQIVIDIPLYLYPILGIPMIIDGVLQKRWNIASNNERRFVTGLLFGFSFVFFFTMYHVLMIAGIEYLMDKIMN